MCGANLHKGVMKVCLLKHRLMTCAGNKGGARYYIKFAIAGFADQIDSERLSLNRISCLKNTSFVGFSIQVINQYVYG